MLRLLVTCVCAVAAATASAPEDAPLNLWSGVTVGLKSDDASVEKGAGELLLTSMDKDGTKSGYDTELLRAISSHVPVPLIASGGVGNLQHLYEGLAEGEADAVLAASIFHQGTHSVGEAKAFLAERGINVRLPPQAA